MDITTVFSCISERGGYAAHPSQGSLAVRKPLGICLADSRLGKHAKAFRLLEHVL